MNVGARTKFGRHEILVLIAAGLRTLHPVCLLTLVAIATMAQSPNITAVENAATNIPSGLPNSAVAQGALFVVKGSGLGPATPAIASSFPLPEAIGGTSIQVSIGGVTVNAIMYYALAQQVAAILPSRTPTGTGTVTVTYNNQSATGLITVVQNNIGVFTVGTTGAGDAVATLAADNTLVSITNAPNPGETVTLWATGLGPVSGDESNPAAGGDMIDVPLRVFIGGKPTKVLYRGRNACCSGVDAIYVTVPQSLTGCAVSIVMQIGNLVSNTPTIPVATRGRTCTPSLTGGPPVGSGTYSGGSLSLGRSVITYSVSSADSTMKSDTASAIFLNVATAPGPVPGLEIDSLAYGSCIVTAMFGGQSTAPPSAIVSARSLDAGAAINLTGPTGNNVLARSTARGGIEYEATLDDTATTLTAGAYTFTGAGGADVGPFTASVNFAAPFNWTNQSNITRVGRTLGVTVTWTGGDPSGNVTIIGGNSFGGSDLANSGDASFACVARVSDGAFTVPAVILLALPPSTSDGGVPNLGSLLVRNNSALGTFRAPGLVYGQVSSYSQYGIPVTYQ